MPKGKPRGSQKNIHCPTCNTEMRNESDARNTPVCGECGTILKIKNIDGVGSAKVKHLDL